MRRTSGRARSIHWETFSRRALSEVTFQGAIRMTQLSRPVGLACALRLCGVHADYRQAAFEGQNLRAPTPECFRLKLVGTAVRRPRHMTLGAIDESQRKAATVVGAAYLFALAPAV